MTIGRLLNCPSPSCHVAHQVVAAVAGRQRDVLDEAEGGDAVPPRVVGEPVGLPQLGRHRVALAADKGGGEAEGVEAAHEQGAEPGVAAELQGERETLLLRQVEGRGIEDDQPR